jgi:hypothetical protein
VYEIVLWQDDTTATTLGTASFDSASSPDTKVGVIGYVDFGQPLDTAYWVDTEVFV